MLIIHNFGMLTTFIWSQFSCLLINDQSSRHLLPIGWLICKFLAIWYDNCAIKSNYTPPEISYSRKNRRVNTCCWRVLCINLKEITFLSFI